jgi:hypothetical protein
MGLYLRIIYAFKQPFPLCIRNSQHCRSSLQNTNNVRSNGDNAMPSNTITDKPLIALLKYYE